MNTARPIISITCGFLLFAITHSALAVPLRGLVSIDITADGQYAVIACRKDNSVAIVTLTGGAPYSFVNIADVGERPAKVRCFDSTAVVVNEWGTMLTLIDVPAATISGQVAVPMYSQDVVWDAARAKFYVSNRWTNRIYVFDDQWNPANPIGGIAAGRMPAPMALGPDGRLYVGNRGSWDVSVIDLDILAEVDRVFIGSRPEGLAATTAAVLVTNHGGADLTLMNGVPLINNDQVDIQNIVTEIDPATLGTTARWIDRGADYAGIDVRAGLIAFTGAGSGSVHVHRQGDPPNVLFSVDLLEVLPGGSVGGGSRIFSNTRDVVPRLPDQLFAVNYLRDTMVELWLLGDGITVASETPLNAVGVPITAFQPQPAVNMTAVQNGERYLNTLSAWRREQMDFTCSTCHPEGHSDFRMIFNDVPDPNPPFGIQGPERHPSTRFSGMDAPYAWEGTNAALEEQNIVALDTHDLPPGTGLVAVDNAGFMAVFMRSVTSGPNPNPSNSAGQALFEGAAGCALCHPGPAFTDGALHDVGTGRTIDTPTLLGVWDQAHLLHDGRASSIEDVLDPAIYGQGNEPHGNLIGLSTQDKADLAAYLRSLGECTPAVYADIDGDRTVDLDDILCTIDGPFNPLFSCLGADIAPCGGDLEYNQQDVLAAIDAFQGLAACPDGPCL